MPLPENIPEETLEVLGNLTNRQNQIDELRSDLDSAIGDRDHWIAVLRAHGWTLENVATFTGLSIAAIRKISKQQGVVSRRIAIIEERSSAG